MENSQRSREELEAELLVLKRQVAELEAKIAGGEDTRDGCPFERPPRRALETDVEFMGDFDVLRAKGVNISEEGICFEVQEDLPFEMRFDLHGKPQTKRAHCVWVRRLPTGGYHFGLRFVPPKVAMDF